MTVPCPTREYFPGESVAVALAPMQLLYGPLSPTPNRSAVDVVAAICLERAA